MIFCDTSTNIGWQNLRNPKITGAKDFCSKGRGACPKLGDFSEKKGGGDFQRIFLIFLQDMSIRFARGLGKILKRGDNPVGQGASN